VWLLSLPLLRLLAPLEDLDRLELPLLPDRLLDRRFFLFFFLRLFSFLLFFSFFSFSFFFLDCLPLPPIC